MKMKIFLFICMTNMVIAGTNDYLFDKYLPQEIIQNPLQHASAKKMIDTKALIHPDLIYYEISKLNLFYSNSLNKDKLINEITAAIENQYLINSSEWYSKQYKTLQDIKIPREIKKYCSKQIKSKIQPFLKKNIEVSIQGNNTAQNLIDYYSYIYLENNDTANYDSLIDYSILRRSAESKKIAHMNSFYQNLTTDYTGSLRDANQFIPYFYLVDQTNFSLTDFYSKLYKSSFAINRHPRFSLSVYYLNARSLNIDESVPIKNYTDSYKMSKTVSTPFYGLQISYDMKIRDFISPVSYISFCSGYKTNGKSIHTIFKSNLNRVTNTADRDFYYRLTFKQNDLAINRIHCANFNISIPILIIHRNIIFETGLQSELFMTKYSHNYSYSFIEQEGFNAGSLWNPYYYKHVIASSNDEVQNSNISYLTFNFNPLLILKMNILSKINLSLNYNFDNVFVSLGMNVY